MVIRLTCARLKAEWLLLLFALVLLIAYVSFCSAGIRNYTNLYSYNQFDYYHNKNLNSYSESGFQTVQADPVTVAMSYGIDPRDLPEKADLHDVYELAILAGRDMLYENIFTTGMLGAFPILDGLAMLLLCPLFSKRRIGQYLSAGYSRRQVFASFTLTYFAFPVLMWGLASLLWLSRYHIPFGAFWVDQLAWLVFNLLSAALAYLAALMLRKPAAAFFAALGVLVLAVLLARFVFKWIIVAAGLGILAAVLIVPWRSFRKRGFAA